MATQYLLIEDVEGLGLSGEVVKNVKPGYARNFLIPRKMVVIADKHTIRLQEKLKEERAKKALEDRQQSEATAARFEGVTLVKVVKVDHDGHMYGSVSIADLVDLIQNELKLDIDKKNIVLKHAIKKTGLHAIQLKLKEGVTAAFDLNVISEEESAKA